MKLTIILCTVRVTMCTEIVCPSPPIVTNALMFTKFVNFTYGAVVTYTCIHDSVTGLQRRFANGNMTLDIVCTDAGSWSEKAPYCDGESQLVCADGGL